MLEFNEAKGIVNIECEVHQSRERPVHLAILSHPFHTFSDENGRFALPAVPKGSIIVSAFAPIHGERSMPLRLEEGESALVLQLTP